jgi:hypothetical protein
MDDDLYTWFTPNMDYPRPLAMVHHLERDIFKRAIAETRLPVAWDDKPSGHTDGWGTIWAIAPGDLGPFWDCVAKLRQGPPVRWKMAPRTLINVALLAAQGVLLWTLGYGLINYWPGWGLAPLIVGVGCAGCFFLEIIRRDPPLG